MQDAQGNYHGFYCALLFSLFDLREATTGDEGNIVANGGLLASDTTPALSGTGTTVSQQVSWVASNVDQVVAQKALPPDFDGRDDALLELWVSSGTTDPASFTALLNFDGAAADVSVTVTDPAPSATLHKVTAKVPAASIPDQASFVSLALTPAAHGTNPTTLYSARLSYFNRVLP